jgi:hypothetical protein
VWRRGLQAVVVPPDIWLSAGLVKEGDANSTYVRRFSDRICTWRLSRAESAGGAGDSHSTPAGAGGADSPPFRRLAFLCESPPEFSVSR